MMRVTHTFAELEISALAYDEIAQKMREAGYDHVFVDGAIDMHGVGLTRAHANTCPVCLEPTTPECDVRGLHPTCALPAPELAGTLPLVLYFGNEADREEFIEIWNEAKPGSITRKL